MTKISSLAVPAFAAVLMLVSCSSHTAPVAVVTPVAAAPAAPLKLEVVKADSEETSGEDAQAAFAADGDPSTFWHTQWESDSPSGPHEIVLKLSRKAALKKLSYLPRQDDSENGCVKDYEVYLSDDGISFGNAVAKGSFDLDKGKEEKAIVLPGKTCRFIKFKALTEVNGEAWTSVAEFGIEEAK